MSTMPDIESTLKEARSVIESSAEMVSGLAGFAHKQNAVVRLNDGVSSERLEVDLEGVSGVESATINAVKDLGVHRINLTLKRQ